MAQLEQQPVQEPPKPLTECSSCHRLRKCNRSGMCRGCVAVARVDAEVAELRRKHPEMTEREVYVAVRTKAARTIRRAYEKAQAG